MIRLEAMPTEWHSRVAHAGIAGHSLESMRNPRGEGSSRGCGVTQASRGCGAPRRPGAASDPQRTGEGFRFQM